MWDPRFSQQWDNDCCVLSWTCDVLQLGTVQFFWRCHWPARGEVTVEIQAQWVRYVESCSWTNPLPPSLPLLLDSSKSTAHRVYGGHEKETELYQLTAEKYGLRLHLKTVRSTETSVNAYKTTQWHNAEYHNQLRLHYYGSYLKTNSELYRLFWELIGQAWYNLQRNLFRAQVTHRWPLFRK
jgi:hypothetical protein